MKSRSKKKWAWKWGTRIVFVGSLIAAAVGGAIAYRALSRVFPDVTLLRSQFPWVEYQGLKKPPRVTLRRDRPPSWVSIDDVSNAAIGAVVVSEDWAFFSHDGYDPREIKEALRKDLAEGRFARGASTITQQVVKNVFLERDKNLGRKLRELVLSIRLDNQVSKRRILETYFNVVEWGEGVFGVAAASRLYFKKTPSELNAKEGAFLAMLLPSPKRYSQSYRDRRLSPYARRTIGAILRKMVRANYLSQESYDEQLSIPLSFEVADLVTAPEPGPREDDEEAEE